MLLWIWEYKHFSRRMELYLVNIICVWVGFFLKKKIKNMPNKKPKHSKVALDKRGRDRRINKPRTKEGIPGRSFTSQWFIRVEWPECSIMAPSGKSTGWEKKSTVGPHRLPIWCSPLGWACKPREAGLSGAGEHLAFISRPQIKCSTRRKKREGEAVLLVSAHTGAWMLAPRLTTTSALIINPRG